MGNSDPGRNGLLSPWGNIQGLYFDDSMEVGDFVYRLENDLDMYHNSIGDTHYIRMEFDNPDDYYEMLLQMQRINDSLPCYGTSIEGQMDIVVDTKDYFNDDGTTEIEETIDEKSKKK